MKKIILIFLLVLGIFLSFFLSSQPKVTQAPVVKPAIAGVQEGATEIVSKRTENTKVFDNHNGTNQYIIHGSPIHYKDGDNNWQEINTNIQPSSANGAGFEMTKSIYKAWFKKTFNTEGIVKMEKEGNSISVSPGDLNWTNDNGLKQLISSPQPVAGEAKETEITYKNAYGLGLDFIYQTYGIKLEKRLIIPDFKVLPKPNEEILNGKNPSIELNLSFETDTAAQIYIDGKLWDKKTIKTQGKIEFIKDGKLLWYFAPPEAWDKTENKISGSIILTGSQDNKYTLSILFPLEWLKNTQGPITLDPTNYYGSTTDACIEGDDNTYTNARATSSSIYASGFNGVGQYKPSFYAIYRTFLEFNTSGIIDTDVVTAATLSMETSQWVDLNLVAFDIQVRQAAWASPMGAGNREANYDLALTSTYDNLFKNTSGFTSNTYYTSSALSTSYINKTGITQYIVMSKEDYDSSAPTNSEFVGFYSADTSGTTSDPYLAVTTVTPTVALTGTVTTANEADIIAGGKTIILTVSNDTWVAAGATFDAQRQNIINGIDSAQSEAHGWDAEVKAKIPVTDVVRTSNTVVTITLSAEASYNITANETITATVPATALTIAAARVASPTFLVTYIANAAPSAPTTLYVNESATGAQSGESNPVAVGDSTPVFSAVYNDSDAGDIANKYEVIVYSDSGCTSLVWDSGSSGTAMTNCTQGNRCSNIDFAGTALLFEGRKYYWKIKYWDDGPAEGTYSDCTANFTMLGPGDQMRHGNYFFNYKTERVFTW